MGDALVVCVPDATFAEGLADLDGVECVVWDGVSEPSAEVARATVLVPPYGGVRVPPARLLAAVPHVEVVQLMSAGAEAWQAAVPAHVSLHRGEGVHTASTAELAVALVLASVRELPRFVRQQDAGLWHCGPTRSLAGQRALVVGAGDIGSAIARRLDAFEVDVTLVGRTARDGVAATADLPSLLPHADVVVVVVPLTDATRGMVDAAFLAAMPDGAVLVNVARGPVVDTPALLAELRTERLRAALDVTDPEPLPLDHPLWTAPGALITPHAGGGTAGWQDRAYAVVRRQLQHLLAGEPLEHVVPTA